MPPFFSPGATDPYGRYYLRPGAGNILGAQVIPQINKRWDITPDDFCGIGRDGYCYYNGQKLTSLENFGSGSLNRLSWGNWEGPLEGGPSYWSAELGPITGTYGGVSSPRMSVDSAITLTPNGDWISFSRAGTMAAATGGYVSGAPRWMIGPGDWDIQLDFQDLAWDNSGYAPNFAVYAMIGALSYCSGHYIKRSSSGGLPAWIMKVGNSISNYPWQGGIDGSGPNNGGITSGSIRIVRTEYDGYNEYAMYCQDSGLGGGWIPVGSTAVTGDRMYNGDYFHVGIVYYRQPTYYMVPAIDGYCSFRLTINSGNIEYRAPWAIMPGECANRGPRPDFPEHPLLVWANNEISIIDLDDPTLHQPVLWKRLSTGNVGVPNQRLFGQGYTCYPKFGYFDDGDLLMPMYDGWPQTILAHFTDNFARRYGGWPDYQTGGTFDLLPGGSGSQCIRSTACIAAANSTEDTGYSMAGWYGSTLEQGFEALNSEAQAAYHWDEDGYRYFVTVTQGSLGGCNVTKWRRGYMLDYPQAYWNYHQLSVTCYDGRIGPSGHLVYCTSSNIYVVLKATWQTGWGTTTPGPAPTPWSPDYTWASPGTRSLASQYYLAISNEGVFVSRDEGIYFRAWGDGSWTLLYGDIGSGATYEILPDYTNINCVSLAFAGSKVIVAIGLTTTGSDYMAYVLMDEEIILFQDVTSELVSAPIHICAEVS